MRTKARRSIIPRPCADCGRTTSNGTRCERCAPAKEAERQARQPYRAVYQSAYYQAQRKIRLRRAGGRCERIRDSVRCSALAQETHHVIALSSAKSLEEALALCRWQNLRAVCWRDNPRGEEG